MSCLFVCLLVCLFVLYCNSAVDEMMELTGCHANSSNERNAQADQLSVSMQENLMLNNTVPTWVLIRGPGPPF